MHSSPISLIAAVDEERGIGKNNRLLWKIPEDMRYFSEKTRGHVVIMGRKTYESIGRPLPGRTNIIVSRTASYEAPGCIVVSSLDEALEKGSGLEKEEIFIIGGASIYEQAIGKADRLYLTLVKGTFGADTFFPDYSAFTRQISQKHSQGNGYEYTFLELARA